MYTCSQLLNLSTTRQKLWPFSEEKFEQMCWNGYSGVTGVMGGSGDWLGAVSLHEMQDMRLFAMSLAMFGQYKFLSALRLMDVVPWCAACNVYRILALSSAGTTTLSPM